MIRVLLVDDDAMVRTGLHLILGGGPDIEIVGEAADGAAGMALVRDARPDVVLLDIRMPVQDGLATLEQIRALEAPPRVLVLTTFDTDDYVLRALRLGADGFLLKDTPPDKVVEAIRTVAAGDPYLSPSVTTTVIAAATGAPDLPARTRQALDSLTEREREVAEALADGSSNAEIAERLFMSVATVKTNITRIFTKLGVENRVAAAMIIHDARR